MLVKSTMIVMKFGGSSVKNADRIRAAKEIILSVKEQKVLVFSALGDTTDNLIAAGSSALSQGDTAVKDNFLKIKNFHVEVARELEVDEVLFTSLLERLEKLLYGISMLQELSPKTKDLLVSFGERLSVIIIASYLNKFFKSEAVNSFDLGLKTDSDYGDANVDYDSLSEVRENLNSIIQGGVTPVVTGFIAKDDKGNITTLGRGGTDLTASLIGLTLEAKEVQVWKDVDGIMTTDPRIVPTAKSLSMLAFEEASEMAYFGAKVLHPLSIQPAMQANIPVRVLNSYNPAHDGTTIVKESVAPENGVRSITCKRNVILVDIVSSRMLHARGFMAKVFNVFADCGISVDMLASSEISISLTVNSDLGLETAIGQLKEFSKVSVSKDRAILSIIGDVSRSSEILGAVFKSFAKNKRQIQMISQGASKVNIGFVVNESESESILTEVHNLFFPVESAA